MTGARLIGVYANHSSNHALIQQTQLKLSDEHGSFILNGKKLTSLHNIMNDEKEYISKNNAGYLAAAVDAATVDSAGAALDAAGAAASPQPVMHIAAAIAPAATVFH